MCNIFSSQTCERHHGHEPTRWALLRLTFLVVAWLFGSLWHAPQTAYAEQVEGEAKREQKPAVKGGAGAGTAASYLERIVSEINWRREQAGTPPLAVAPETANAALSHHAADLTFLLQASGGCFHGVGDPPRFGWDYVAETGFSSEQRGEVIACPSADGYWTAERVADSWWGSPRHREVLYNDPTSNIVACGIHGSLLSGVAYETVVCLTYQS